MVFLHKNIYGIVAQFFFLIILNYINLMSLNVDVFKTMKCDTIYNKYGK